MSSLKNKVEVVFKLAKIAPATLVSLDEIATIANPLFAGHVLFVTDRHLNSLKIIVSLLFKTGETEEYVYEFLEGVKRMVAERRTP